LSQQIIIGIWLGLAIIAANLPWLSERWLFVIVRQGGQAKPFWLRLIEWGLLYALILAMGFGFEYKAAGRPKPCEKRYGRAEDNLLPPVMVYPPSPLSSHALGVTLFPAFQNPPKISAS
jgi:hypothetical protein